MGDRVSIVDYCHVGSSVSVRGRSGRSKFHQGISICDYLGVGSSFSLRGRGLLGDKADYTMTSILTLAHYGSSLSLRSLARFASSTSVLNFVHLSSTISVRNFCRLGSSLSVYGDLITGEAGNAGSAFKMSMQMWTVLGSSLSVRSVCKGGSVASILNFLTIGSSVSVRQMTRLSSSISASCHCRIGPTLSIMQAVTFSSSLSVRGRGRLRGNVGKQDGLSVFGSIAIGSSFSLRAYARMGSTFSVFKRVKIGADMSVFNRIDCSSCLSIRSHFRMSATVSVLDFVMCGSGVSVRSTRCAYKGVSVFGFLALGSNLSLRAAARQSSGTSIYGIGRIGVSKNAAAGGSGSSIMNYLNLGSSMSIRSFARFGSALSICDSCSFGSSVSVRSFMRLGSGLSVSNLKVHSKFQFGMDSAGTAFNYILAGDGSSRADAGQGGGAFTPAIYAWGMFTRDTTSAQKGRIFFSKTASASPVGSTPNTDRNYLVGTWSSTGVIGTSDLRLKKNVKDLRSSLVELRHWRDKFAAGKLGEGEVRNDTIIHGPKPFMTIDIEKRKPNCGDKVWDDEDLFAGDNVNNMTNKSELLNAFRKAKSTSTEDGFEYAVLVSYKDGRASTTKCFKTLKAAQLHAASLEFKELRPVAYHMRRDVESKQLHYGFIAQELAELYPGTSNAGRADLVYDKKGNYIGGDDDIKDPSTTMGIAYDDIISVLTLMVKHSIEQLDDVETRLNSVAEKIVREQGSKVSKQARKLAALRQEIENLKKTEIEDLKSIDEQVAEKLGKGRVAKGFSKGTIKKGVKGKGTKGKDTKSKGKKSKGKPQRKPKTSQKPQEASQKSTSDE